ATWASDRPPPAIVRAVAQAIALKGVVALKSRQTRRSQDGDQQSRGRVPGIPGACFHQSIALPEAVGLGDLRSRDRGSGRPSAPPRPGGVLRPGICIDGVLWLCEEQDRQGRGLGLNLICLKTRNAERRMLSDA